MKKSSINIRTNPLAQIVSSVLIAFAAFLVTAALMAQPSGNARPPVKGCKDWPSDKDQAKVEAAFDKVLNDSATDMSLRNELIDTTNCYKKPKEAVQKVLYGLPGDKVTIPKEVLIIFYEDDTPDLKRDQPPRDSDYASDHCLHIFFLPQPGAQTTTKTSFKNNLMCCYKPWRPPH